MNKPTGKVAVKEEQREEDKKGNIDTLKDRHLYRIHARNAHYGVWIAEKKSFLISRWKFGENYPFEEYHWDAGEGGNISYGTAYEIGEAIEKPVFDVKLCPTKACDGSEYMDWGPRKEFLEHLNKLEDEYIRQTYGEEYVGRGRK